MQLIRSIRGGSELLYRVGLAHLAIFFVFFALSQFDHRQTMGLNTWLKPMKFAVSIWIYLWTFGWLLLQQKDRTSKVRWISYGIAITMVIEMLLIGFQAGRAQASHFNFSNYFNETVYRFMGLAIGINFLLNFYTMLLFYRSQIPLDKPMLAAVRSGFVLFLLASSVGWIMVAQSGHAVGTTDGGPGLPFLNWSLESGDLRVAHFLGMHALQILPISAWLFSRFSDNPYFPLVGVIATAAFLAAVFIAALIQALSGQPLISL